MLKHLQRLVFFFEKKVYGKYDFKISNLFPKFHRLKALTWYALGGWRWASAKPGSKEIICFIYSEAGKRMLPPVLESLARRAKERNMAVRLCLVLAGGKIKKLHLQRLKSIGCSLQMSTSKLMEAARHPEDKLVLLCLDHREFYQDHKIGVDVADKLQRFGVKTISIQHGGCRQDSLKGLSTSASSLTLVWGEIAFRELTCTYGLAAKKLRLVGNLLHDRWARPDLGKILERVVATFPRLKENGWQKTKILLAGCNHREYDHLDRPPYYYQLFLKNIYTAIDFSKAVLFVLPHPVDKTGQKEWCWQYFSEREQVRENIYIVDPEECGIDIYDLLIVSDLVMTRASTVAEEALILGKTVVGYDVVEKSYLKQYSFLKEFRNFHSCIDSSPEGLRKVLDDLIATVSTRHGTFSIDAQAERFFTYRLDGQSGHRTADAILEELW